MASQIIHPSTNVALERTTNRRGSSVWSSRRVKTARKMKMTERCWEMVHAPSISGQYRYGSTFAVEKVRILQSEFEEALITVLRQTRKERRWDIVVREWLKSPQNTLPPGSILRVTSPVGFCRHHSDELVLSLERSRRCAGPSVRSKTAPARGP